MSSLQRKWQMFEKQESLHNLYWSWQNVHMSQNITLYPLSSKKKTNLNNKFTWRQLLIVKAKSCSNVYQLIKGLANCCMYFYTVEYYSTFKKIQGPRDASVWVGFVRMMVRERHIMSFSLYKTIRQASSQRRKVEWWTPGAGEEAWCVGPIRTADGYTPPLKHRL